METWSPSPTLNPLHHVESFIRLFCIIYFEKSCQMFSFLISSGLLRQVHEATTLSNGLCVLTAKQTSGNNCWSTFTQAAFSSSMFGSIKNGGGEQQGDGRRGQKSEVEESADSLLAGRQATPVCCLWNVLVSYLVCDQPRVVITAKSLLIEKG